MIDSTLICNCKEDDSVFYPYVYRSVEKFNEVEYRFKKSCDIYRHAALCFTYANALNTPRELSWLTTIEGSEMLQIFKYATSRLALIEVVKLLKSKDRYSLSKFLNFLSDKSTGNIVNVVGFEAVRNMVLKTESDSTKFYSLRDNVFAHNDSPAKIKHEGIAALIYTDVEKLLKDVFDLLDAIQPLLPSIAPFQHTNRVYGPNPQLYEILSFIHKMSMP